MNFWVITVSQDKSVFFLCGYACLYFSDILAYGYDVMMLNVIRYYITIKIQHGIRATLKEVIVQPKQCYSYSY